ncbi:EAL domain-containing protein [Acinetobacter sp.]|uniref:EAL domain-containing protein n=1 Tax=Acinetobacter sp. TaxID=472 RepID=UPI00388F725C
MQSSLKNKHSISHAQDCSIPTHISRLLAASASERTLNILNLIPQLLCIKTKSQHYFCNTALNQYLGKNLNHSARQHIGYFIHPEDRENLTALWDEASILNQDFQKECRIKNLQQRYQWFRINVQFKPHPDLDWIATLDCIHNYVVERKLYKQQQINQKKFLDSSADCIKVFSPDGRITYINQFGRNVLLEPEQKLNNLFWLNLLDKTVQPQGVTALTKAQKGHQARFSSMTQRRDEPIYHWDNLLTPLLDEKGQVKHILCISRDTSQQILAEKRLEHAYTFDDLTQLYNRRAFHQLLEQSIVQAQADAISVGLVMLDLDCFKNLNDTLGHMAGDHLLKVFAYRLKKAFPEPMVVARFGSDEFAIIIPDLKSKQELIDYAQRAAEQLNTPIYYESQYINGGISIGCASYPENASSAAHLVRCADTALNDLKKTGGGGVLPFNHDMLQALERTAQKLNLARKILLHDSVVPYYQPKVNLKTGKIVGFEALLRWYDQGGGVQSPVDIEPAFEDFALATRMSEVMQRKVFSDIRYCLEHNIRLHPVAINAAPVEFLRDNYAEILLARLDEYNIAPQFIEIEITEQSLEARGASYVLRALKKLKHAGIRIALDDFGTGHSSLTRLKDYPIDILKIDRSFIEKMHTDPSILAIVTAIGQLGPSMQIEILAEGIETSEHVASLEQRQCVTGQGFYFHKPMPIDEVITLIKSL